MSDRKKWGYAHVGDVKENERLRQLEVVQAAKDYQARRLQDIEKKEATARKQREEREEKGDADEFYYWEWGYGPVVASAEQLSKLELERRREVAVAASDYVGGRRAEAGDGAAGQAWTGDHPAESASAVDRSADNSTELRQPGTGSTCRGGAAAASSAAEESDTPPGSSRADCSYGEHPTPLTTFLVVVAEEVNRLLQQQRQEAGGRGGSDSDEDLLCLQDFVEAIERLVEDRTAAQQDCGRQEATVKERRCLGQLMEVAEVLQAEAEQAVHGAASLSRVASLMRILSATAEYIGETTSVTLHRSRRLEDAIRWDNEEEWFSHGEDEGDSEES